MNITTYAQRIRHDSHYQFHDTIKFSGHILASGAVSGVTHDGGLFRFPNTMCGILMDFSCFDTKSPPPVLSRAG